MTVGELVNLAAKGELKNVAVRDDVETVLGYINLGLIEMYKRFPLKVEEYVIELIEGQTIYEMPSNFMWIVSAYQEVPEDEMVDYVANIPINKEDDVTSLNTIGWNQVQVPLVSNGAYISVIYIAAPDILTSEDLDVQLPIPPQMIDTMLLYIAYKGHASVNPGDQEKIALYQEFEASCDRLIAKGMINQDDLYTDDKIKARGFV